MKIVVVVTVLCGLAVLAACGADTSHVIDLADAAAGTELNAATSTTSAPDAATAATHDASTAADEEGEATYYDANGTGACGFKASTDFYVVAMNGAEYKSAICGSCIDVTGPKGSVVVRITDKCPGCGEGGLDLSITAFTKIGDKSDGRIAVKWHYVDCP